ncbi:MAG: thioredoxin-dependent thiol peroxidase [Alphaproteobacteria bacterium]|nr:thioredoxin-dependent thiol peroxidase [Alphaproteobacteria bacterium]
MRNLKIGDRAPDFTFRDQSGNSISLKDLKGKKVILYFYPRDLTPGCTAEACNLRDNYQLLTAKGFFIIGVSADDEISHQKFSEKNALPFILIPDKTKNIIRDYGAWGEKKLYGKTYEGILRMTYILNEEGFIEHIFSKVDTKNHTAQILKELDY